MTEDMLQEIEKRGNIDRMTPKLAHNPSYSLYTRNIHEASTISIACCSHTKCQNAKSVHLLAKPIACCSHTQCRLAKCVHLLAKRMIQVLPGHLDGSILSGYKFRLAGGHLAVG